MKDIGKRLKQLRTFFSLTQKEFGKRIGKSWITINRWEAGDRPIPEPLLHQIANIFGVSYTWLKTGEGEMFESKLSNRVSECQGQRGDLWVVPLLEKENEPVGIVVIKKVASMKKEELFALEVKDDSMNPTLLEGDIVIAKAYEGDGSDIPNKKLVITATQEGKLEIRRIIKQDKQVLFTADNPAYPPASELKIVGIGLKLLREFKL